MFCLLNFKLNIHYKKYTIYGKSSSKLKKIIKIKSFFANPNNNFNGCIKLNENAVQYFSPG